MALELVNGGEITSGQLRANHDDVTYFINAGNMLHVTVNGKRRYSIVPTDAGEEYLAASTALVPRAAEDPAGDSADEGGVPAGTP